MFKLVTAASADPISLVEAKLYLRVTHSDEDDLITSLIISATNHAETYLNRSLVTQTWDYYLDSFQDEMIIQKSPIASVTSIKYQDSDDAKQTLSTSIYNTDLISEPARISKAYSQDWPSVYEKINSIVMRLVSGFGAASDVPEQIKSGMYLYITYLYEHRGDESIRPPRAIFDLWNNYRVQYL